MTVSATLASGDSAPLPDVSAIPAFVFPSESGTGSVYQFNPGDDVYATLGSSRGTEGVLWYLRNAKQPCVVAVCTGTAGTKSAIVHSGTGPTVTASYTSPATAPLLSTILQSKILVGGLNGAASIGYCLDGSGDYGQYTASVPQEGPAVLLGTVDLASLTLSTLNTLTLVTTAPVSTTTFTTPTTVQDIADQINAAASATILRAEIAQTAAGSFLRLYSTTLGTGVTLTIDDVTSTGEAILGFATAASNLTIVGTAATLPIPFTGITLTFPAGTYVADDTYSMTTTGPTASTAAIAAAADVLRADVAKPFGYLMPLTVPTNASNARGLCDALDAKISAWDSDAEQPIFPIQLTPGTWHTPSATAATNATNITTADLATLAAFAGHASIGTVIPGDGYATGTKLSGSYRQPAALAVAYMLSAFSLSDDVGAATHKHVPEWSLTAPDGVTLARDEANPSTVNKLGGSRGPGFTVLRNVDRLPRVKRGVTRAGLTSRLVDLGAGLRMGRRGQAVLYRTAKDGVENENFQTASTGILLDVIRTTLEGVFREDLEAALLTPPLALHASSVGVVIASEVIADTKTVTVTATLQKLGGAENVTIRALVAGIVKSVTLA